MKMNERDVFRSKKNVVLVDMYTLNLVEVPVELKTSNT
jgi:hypothetical protein